MKKFFLIILLVILLGLSYFGYSSFQKAKSVKESVEKLSEIDYEKIKSNINNINYDINSSIDSNNPTLSSDSLEDIYDSLLFLQNQYENISKLSPKVSEVISYEQLNSIVNNVDTIIDNNSDKDLISLSPDSLDSDSLNALNNILNLSYELNLDESQIQELLSDFNIKNLLP